MDLEGLGAACEAECEVEGQRSVGWSLEGELLQEGSEEDEELSPGKLLPRTCPLAWKRSKNNPTESPVSFNLLLVSSCTWHIAQAVGAFLPRKVRWQCSPTHFAETFPRSLLLSKL